jgi:DNA-binding PadR family transcriptional regulator
VSVLHYDDVLDGLRGELRRGSLVIAVLCGLGTERSGGGLKARLAKANVTITEGALYPMLRRLETQGLLRSDWRLHESRNKRFYVLTANGQRVRDALISDWRTFDQAFESLRS